MRRPSIAGKNFDRNLLILKGADRYRADKAKAGSMGAATETERKKRATRLNGMAVALYHKLDKGDVTAIGTHKKYGKVRVVITVMGDLFCVKGPGILMTYESCRDLININEDGWSLVYPKPRMVQ